MLNNKGNLQMMYGLALFLGTIIILMAISSQIVQQVSDNVGENTTARNVTREGNQGIQQFAEFAQVIGLIIVAVIVFNVLRLMTMS